MLWTIQLHSHRQPEHPGDSIIKVILVYKGTLQVVCVWSWDPSSPCVTRNSGGLAETGYDKSISENLKIIGNKYQLSPEAKQQKHATGYTEVSTDNKGTWPQMPSLWCLSLRRKGCWSLHLKYSCRSLVLGFHSEINTYKIVYCALLFIHRGVGGQNILTGHNCEGNRLAWEENPFFSWLLVTTVWFLFGIEDATS